MPEFADIGVQRAAPFYPKGDFAAALAAPIRKKFKRLRSAAERERADQIHVSDRRMATMEALAAVETELASLIKSRPSGHADITAAERQLASLREDTADLNAKYGDKSKGTLSSLVQKLEMFLATRRIFALADATAPTLKKGESIEAAIENRRRRLRELAADLKAVEVAPWPSDITKAKMRKQITELAERGEPDVFALVERGESVEFPTLPAVVDMRPAYRCDAAALIAWALGPALVDALSRAIDGISDDEKALTAEQRKDRTEQIKADILAVEREEESLIELAEAKGTPVLRRSDADPRAVLGIS